MPQKCLRALKVQLGVRLLPKTADEQASKFCNYVNPDFRSGFKKKIMQRERERERDKRERKREREKERDRERGRDRPRETDRQR